MEQTEWFKRSFPVITDNGLLPAIIERLAGTPARLEELTNHTDASLLTLKKDGKWTIKEQAGHLGDMEPLWLGRLVDLINGVPELTVADLTNQRTHTANHDATPLTTLQQHFRTQRQQFTNRLLNLSDDQLLNAALHPRLKTPMRIIDLAWFVAEHDDHHLAAIREIIRAKE